MQLWKASPNLTYIGPDLTIHRIAQNLGLSMG
jgi:hypothetical protein